jgi:putative ABC transport system substrate-binding protein
VAATSEIPVVFTAVTDPLGAKLVSDLQKPGANVTGMSDLSPIAKHLELIKEVTPNAKKIGVPFNPGEANAVTLVDLLKSEGAKMGYEIVEAPAPKSSDVLAAAQSLVGKSDVIYVPTDNTIVSALEAVIQVGADNKLPVFAGDTDSVKRGAIAAIGFNYYDVGRQTGQIVARVLKGEKPGDIAVQGVEITELYVNPGAAAQMGVELSSDIIGKAKEVVK